MTQRVLVCMPNTNTTLLIYAISLRAFKLVQHNYSNNIHKLYFRFYELVFN